LGGFHRGFRNVKRRNFSPKVYLGVLGKLKKSKAIALYPRTNCMDFYYNGRKFSDKHYYGDPHVACHEVRPFRQNIEKTIF
jgi:hypothetical protein